MGVYQMAHYSIYSVLHLTRAHRTLVKSSALCREYCAIWDATSAVYLQIADVPVGSVDSGPTIDKLLLLL